MTALGWGISLALVAALACGVDAAYWWVCGYGEKVDHPG